VSQRSTALDATTPVDASGDHERQDRALNRHAIVFADSPSAPADGVVGGVSDTFIFRHRRHRSQ
jgi:hypothetical protein